MAERCTVTGGDFFGDVPAGGDLCVLKSMIHDWDDERSIAILRNCRQAVVDVTRLLLIERVIPPGNEPSFAKLPDLNMLVNTGGRERTEADYGELFQRAGLGLARVIPTGVDVS